MVGMVGIGGIRERIEIIEIIGTREIAGIMGIIEVRGKCESERREHACRLYRSEILN